MRVTINCAYVLYSRANFYWVLSNPDSNCISYVPFVLTQFHSSFCKEKIEKKRIRALVLHIILIKDAVLNTVCYAWMLKLFFCFLLALKLLLLMKNVYLDSSHGLPFLQGIFRFSCTAATAAAAAAAVVDCDDDGVIMALWSTHTCRLLIDICIRKME